MDNTLRLLVIIPFFLHACVRQPGKFRGSIVDDQSGEIVPARVYITNLDGVRIEPDGKHEHVDYLSKKWCYSDGTFSVSAPHKDTG